MQQVIQCESLPYDTDFAVAGGLPPDAYVKSLARFAANLTGAARKLVIARAALVMSPPTQPVLPAPAAVQRSSAPAHVAVQQHARATPPPAYGNVPVHPSRVVTQQGVLGAGLPAAARPGAPVLVG